MHKLEECLNQNDLSINSVLEYCVETFVNELAFVMSDYHKLYSLRHVNKSNTTYM